MATRVYTLCALYLTYQPARDDDTQRCAGRATAAECWVNSNATVELAGAHYIPRQRGSQTLKYTIVGRIVPR